MDYDAIVLAGGEGRRMGGADKAELEVGGARLIDRVLDATRGAATTVVVGPPRSAARPVKWTREAPAGSGPVAALEAGLRLCGSEVVVVVAVDHPFVSSTTIETLLRAIGDRDGAILVDGTGQSQPLVGAYSRAALATAVEGLASPRGAAVRELIAELDLAPVPDARASADLDDPNDLDAARRAESSPPG